MENQTDLFNINESCLAPQKDGYHLTDDVRITSQIKKVLEYYSIDSEFAAKLKETPDKALQDINVDIPFDKIEPLLIKGTENTVLSDEALCYNRFVINKLKSRNYMQQKGCVPTDSRFRHWRERQLNRCLVEMGPRNQAMIHAPLIFELTDGCSIGCPFCGINADRLKGIYRHTPENAELFRDILKYMKTLLGDSAGSGTCYYATEPLDNPDYEEFIKDYYEVLGMIPQTTTAAAMREPERTAKMLADFHKMYRHIHRFSVLSLETFREIMDFFTPEQLLYVELLPQFPQAPSNHFSAAGRNRNTDDENAYNVGTICCVSGLVINMVRKEIRLISPCGVDQNHPTGELVAACGTFTDIASFENVLKDIMDKHMKKTDFSQPVSFYPYLNIEYTENGIIIKSRGGYENTLEIGNAADINIPGITAKLIVEGGRSINQIADILEEKYGIDYTHSYYMLGKWHQSGFLTMQNN